MGGGGVGGGRQNVKGTEKTDTKDAEGKISSRGAWGRAGGKCHRKEKRRGAPGWLSQLSDRLMFSAHVMIS